MCYAKCVSALMHYEVLQAYTTHEHTYTDTTYRFVSMSFVALFCKRDSTDYTEYLMPLISVESSRERV